MIAPLHPVPSPSCAGSMVSGVEPNGEDTAGQDVGRDCSSQHQKIGIILGGMLTMAWDNPFPRSALFLSVTLRLILKKVCDSNHVV